MAEVAGAPQVTSPPFWAWGAEPGGGMEVAGFTEGPLNPSASAHSQGRGSSAFQVYPHPTSPVAGRTLPPDSEAHQNLGLFLLPSDSPPLALVSPSLQ